MIHYHNDSVAQALVDLFPTIGIDKAKFSSRCMFSFVSHFFHFF